MPMTEHEYNLPTVNRLREMSATILELQFNIIENSDEQRALDEARRLLNFAKRSLMNRTKED
jgi:hypothetical protein